MSDRREKKHKTYMKIAHNIADLSTCGRKNVGAVVIKNDRMVGAGYNGAPSGAEHCDDVGHLMHQGSCQRAIHAEQNAIIVTDRRDLQGSVVYVTTRPCINCFNALANAGVDKIYYDEEYDHPTKEDVVEISRQTETELECLK